MATPKFTDLASEISDNAEILEKFLTNAGGIPRPTFAPGGPLGFPAPPKAVEVHLARERMIDTANKLIRLALGPVETLFTLATTVRSNWRRRKINFRLTDDDAESRNCVSPCNLLVRHGLAGSPGRGGFLR